ncbi:MAG TPA: amidohydrolase family protein [Planctomycetota bacterium]|nr:amidohydrolase family protein [Planctomycetota bacterium]
MSRLIIDAHNHVNWVGTTTDQYIANMDKYGIDIMWALSWEAFPDEFATTYYSSFQPGNLGMPFSNILEARSKYPDRIVAGYCPNPRDPYAVEKLKSAHHFGARVCGEWKFRVMFDNPDTIAIYRLAGELKMPITLHLDICLQPGSREHWYGGTLDSVIRAVEACPEANFIGHAPGFWRYISGDADQTADAYPKTPVTPGGRLFSLLEKYPNLYADISAGSGATALSRTPSVGREFVLKFQDRLVYGRDFTDNRHQEILASLDLPAAVLDKLYFQNALKLAPLPDNPIVQRKLATK